MRKTYRKKAATRGQSSVEYLVALAVVVGVFFASNGQESLIGLFSNSVRTGYSNFYTAMSLPN
jgi:hypothetical protein